MDAARQVSDLIGDIYDAALDPTRWSHVLERTCDYVGGIAAVLIAHEQTTKAGQFYFTWGDDPAYTASYNQTFAKINPLVLPIATQAKAGDVVAVADLIPHEEYFASRFYREWAAPQGYIDAVHGVLEKSATSYASVAVARHVRHGLVDDATRRRMALLLPHFRRAVNIGKLIDLHKVEAAVLADTFDGLAAAFFLVDADARIVHANTNGRSMLAEGIVLRENGGKLSGTDPYVDQSLRDVFTAAGGGDVDLGTKGVAVPLAAGDSGPFIAHVLPLTSGARRRAGTSYSAVAAVFVRKAAFDLPSPPETIANLYNLTTSEMRVLMAIIEVGGVPEVAPVLGVSETTVRTHLQHVFEKTRTNRQADLVKLVAGYTNPLGG